MGSPGHVGQRRHISGVRIAICHGACELCGVAVRRGVGGGGGGGEKSREGLVVGVRGGEAVGGWGGGLH